MSWKFCVTASNTWKYIVSASNTWKYTMSELAGDLTDYTSLMAFWSDEFNFTTKVLTDKSGNTNHVPLVAGNCVNFINDVTITLSTAKMGATVTEVNFSETTTGVTVNGSGHIEIDQSELVSAKLYQIKLSTGDEFFLTGGTNYYVFCKPTLYGTIGEVEDTDWEWSTQDNYFGNLQNGFSKAGILGALPLAAMNAGTWYAGATARISKESATEQKYTEGGDSLVSDSYIYTAISRRATKVYRIKMTTWDSTEDFGDNEVRLKYYLGTSATIGVDNDGIQLSKNGVHYITAIFAGGTDRIQVQFYDSGVNWTGRSMKYNFEFCEVDTSIFIPAYNTTDAVGNTLTSPPDASKHNGCEVQLDFSGITGVTGSDGGAYSPPSDYSFSDSLANPMFKRVAYNSELKELESDYIVFKSFINGSTLSSVLDLLEESNMLIKYFPDLEDQPIFTVQKFDSTRDLVTIFSKVGYNELYTYAQQGLVDNSKQLPVGVAIDSLGSYNNTSDRIGPYNISGLGWCGGAHIAPSCTTPDDGWEDITVKDDTKETVTIEDVTEYPNPTTKTRVFEIYNWNGSTWELGVRGKYLSVVDGVVQLSSIYAPGVDLSSVTAGGATPSKLTYQFMTAEESERTMSSDSEEWVAAKSFELNVISDILDYTTVDKSTLIGMPIIQSVVNYKLSQKSPTVYIDYSSKFLSDQTVNLYYGIQGGLLASGTNLRNYIAHSDDLTMKVPDGRESGDRLTYPAEKVIQVDDITDNAASYNTSNFVDLSYGTPSQDKSTSDYWLTSVKNYFKNVLSQAYSTNDEVLWRGGFNAFKNHSTTQYVLAYFQVENGSLYFIVDFTDSLTFGSINEVFTDVSGRKVEVTYQDDGIAIAADPDTIFTIPDTGLDLTATEAGNIKLKFV